MYKLYDLASQVNVEPEEAQLFLRMIENSINKATIQHERIVHDELTLYKIKRWSERKTRFNTMLFADIHYYLLCWTEFRNLLLKLRRIQPFFHPISKKYGSLLHRHKEFRNHLEHIEKEIGTVSDLGNLVDGVFTYNNQKIDVREPDLITFKKIYLELLNAAYTNFKQSPTWFREFKSECLMLGITDLRARASTFELK